MFLYIETVLAFCVTIVRHTIRYGPLASPASGNAIRESVYVGQNCDIVGRCSIA